MLPPRDRPCQGCPYSQDTPHQTSERKLRYYAFQREGHSCHNERVLAEAGTISSHVDQDRSRECAGSVYYRENGCLYKTTPER